VGLVPDPGRTSSCLPSAQEGFRPAAPLYAMALARSPFVGVRVAVCDRRLIEDGVTIPLPPRAVEAIADPKKKTLCPQKNARPRASQAKCFEAHGSIVKSAPPASHVVRITPTALHLDRAACTSRPRGTCSAAASGGFSVSVYSGLPGFIRLREGLA